jgi:hypothetical protein
LEGDIQNRELITVGEVFECQAKLSESQENCDRFIDFKIEVGLLFLVHIVLKYFRSCDCLKEILLESIIT